jgi:glycerol-3-phosphate acyltransferase PlsY
MGRFLGHCYPVWLRFRGGKGVATLMGIVSRCTGRRARLCRGLARAARGAAHLVARRHHRGDQRAGQRRLLGRIDLVLLLLALALIVLWKHRENIDRLLSGTEPRIGKKRG